MSPIKTLIIVESPNDEAFIRLLLNNLSLSSVEVEPIETIGIENLHKIEGTDIRGKSALDEKIDKLKGQLRIEKYSKVEHISVILDSDSPPTGGVQKSIELVNNAFGSRLRVYPNFTHEAEQKKITANIGGELISISVSCYFVKMENGEGHLDMVLKAIATKVNEVLYCQCMEDVLLPCVQQKGGTIGDFEKQWINFYIRSFATPKQLKSADGLLPKLIVDKGKDIFDLDHKLLKGLNNYLKSL